MFNIKNIVKFAAGAAATVALCAPSWAQFSKVVIFGDSMSDTHRWYDFNKAVDGVGYPGAPGMPGRFSDGPVAVEVLAKGLNADIEVYAFSGALSGYTTLVVLPIGVLTQVNEYLNNNALVPNITTIPLLSYATSLVLGPGKADPKALHVIWTGPDDYYAPGGYNPLTAYKVTANIQQAIVSLYQGGARYFFVPGMPDLSVTPAARHYETLQKGYTANAAKYSIQFASVLEAGLNQLRKNYPQAKIMSFDTMSFMKPEIEKGRAEGKNVTDACYPGGIFKTTETRTVCPDPENYLFWDDNHPTALGNRILGEAWVKAIVYKP